MGQIHICDEGQKVGPSNDTNVDVERRKERITD